MSYSVVEDKGMQPNAVNFSDRTTSIYVFVLPVAWCGGAIFPGMCIHTKKGGQKFFKILQTFLSLIRYIK